MKDPWIERGEGERLDSLETAVEKLGVLVLKWVERMEARKNHDPSPSNLPAPPEFARAVADEARRLRQRYTGTTKDLMAQARKNVVARSARLDGEAVPGDAEPRSGGTLDGRPLHAGPKRRPRLL